MSDQTAAVKGVVLNEGEEKFLLCVMKKFKSDVDVSETCASYLRNALTNHASVRSRCCGLTDGHEDD